MKRRTFLKGMAGILSSVMAGRSLASSEKAIPDPVRERFSELHTVYPETLGITHPHDLMRYDIMMDKEWYHGAQWPKAEQREMNLRRSRMLEKMSKYKFNRIKTS